MRCEEITPGALARARPLPSRDEGVLVIAPSGIVRARAPARTRDVSP
jgi:hypothetical protein